MRRPNPFVKIWGVPLVLAMLVLFGLLSALLGTGIWHFFSWITLAIPVIVLIDRLYLRKRSSAPPK